MVKGHFIILHHDSSIHLPLHEYIDHLVVGSGVDVSTNSSPIRGVWLLPFHVASHLSARQIGLERGRELKHAHTQRKLTMDS